MHEALASLGRLEPVRATRRPAASRHPESSGSHRPETLPAAVPNDPDTVDGAQPLRHGRARTLPRLRFGRSYRLRLRTSTWSAGPARSGKPTPSRVGDLAVAAVPALRAGGRAVAAAHTAYGEGESLHRGGPQRRRGDPGGVRRGLQRRVPRAPRVRAGRRAAPRPTQGELRPGREARPVRPRGIGLGRHRRRARCRWRGSPRPTPRSPAARRAASTTPRAPGAQVVDLPRAGRRHGWPLRAARRRPARAAVPARPARDRGGLLGAARGATRRGVHPAVRRGGRNLVAGQAAAARARRR